jgi:hypothetical protein
MRNPFQDFDWDYLVSTNQVLCKKSGYQHGVTSDGYEPAKAIFRKAADEPSLDMVSVTETLRQLHKAAPFLFLNGNTFADVGKTILSMAFSTHSPEIRSVVGHHIAGKEILSMEELARAFEEEAKRRS